jgi:dCMP deaminase
MHAAEGYAALSYAKRAKVGAVLLRDDRVISIGYNGTPAGRPNRCEEIAQDAIEEVWVTKPEVVHAEMNAIAFAAKNGISTDGATMVITMAPCFECSRLLIQAGIREVIYRDDYRDMEGAKFLELSGVLCASLAAID